MNTPNTSCIDVTLRDGGYINNWAFSRDFVARHVAVCSSLGIDICEVGYVNNLEVRSDKSFLKNLVPEDLAWLRRTVDVQCKIAVMCDFGKYDVGRIPPADVMGAELIRITSDPPLPAQVWSDVRILKSKGYTVSLNVTHASDLSDIDTLRSTIHEFHREHLCPDIVCFADSFGAMYPTDVKRVFSAMKGLPIPTGFHGHNNMQLAFANSLEAMEYGATIIDGSFFGMGKAAGNLHVENLMQYLNKIKHKYDMSLALDYLDIFKLELSHLGWGYSLPMMIAGELNVHPEWVQYLVKTRFGSLSSLRRALGAIPSHERSRFSSLKREHIAIFMSSSWLEEQVMRCPPQFQSLMPGDRCMVFGKGPHAAVADTIGFKGQLVLLLAADTALPSLAYFHTCQIIRVFATAVKAQQYLSSSKPTAPEVVLAPDSPLLLPFAERIFSLPVYHSEMRTVRAGTMLGIPTCSTGLICCAVAAWMGFKQASAFGIFGLSSEGLHGTVVSETDVEVLNLLEKDLGFCISR